VNEIISGTSFPVDKNHDLIQRAEKLQSIAEKYDIDLIVHSNSDTWNYIFDSYAFIPLTHSYRNNAKKIISVNLNRDRRTWLYDDAKNCKRILLYGFHFDQTLFAEDEYIIIDESNTVIFNHKRDVSKLFSTMNLKFGNESY
jgi:hypothetical protein